MADEEDQDSNHENDIAARREATLRREAARRLGQARSEKKRAAVRENGKKGGRPPGTRTSDEAKARMREAQRERRRREKEQP